MQSKITLRKIYTAFFFVGIFFIPFNEFEGWSLLGEYSDEAATYFFLGGFILLVIESLFKGKINIPYNNSLSFLLISFLIWTLVSTLINYNTVSTNYFKQITGFNRYIRQSFSLIISAVIFTIFFWNVIRNYSVYNIFLKIRRVFFYSFIFVAIYGFIEIGIVFFNMGFLMPILESFDLFPFVNTKIHAHRLGISSITFEVPALGTYLLTILPWMLSYIYTEKRWIKFAPTFAILILLYFSDSRSALIIISVQLLVLIGLLIYDKRYRSKILRFLRYSLMLIVLLTFNYSEQITSTVAERIDRINFSKNLTENVSNKSRFGMQHAALEVFKQEPLAGVGLGQLAYHSRFHYPYWATANNYEFDLYYKNEQLSSFPPIYNFYLRVLSELGIIGIIIWLSILFLSFYYSVLLWKYSTDKYRFIGMILILSFVGMIINWMQVDHFKQYGFWLCLILLIKYRFDYNKISSEND